MGRVRRVDVTVFFEPTQYLPPQDWLRQYDHQVGTNTEIRPGQDAALIRVKGTNKHLAMAADCNGRHVYLDPHVGTAGILELIDHDTGEKFNGFNDIYMHYLEDHELGRKWPSR